MELMFVPDQFLSPRNLAAVDKLVGWGKRWGKFQWISSEQRSYYCQKNFL